MCKNGILSYGYPTGMLRVSYGKGLETPMKWTLRVLIKS